jgi:SAM-dependent methyltransferase
VEEVFLACQPVVERHVHSEYAMRVERYFDETFDEWEAIYRRRTVWASIYQRRLRAAVESVDRLRLARGSVALDVGCGPGLGTVCLGRRGFTVHAVDVSRRMVDRTLARARRECVGAAVRGTVGDLRALAFSDGAFHLVLAVGVSEWLPSLEPALAEIARVLGPGGHLVMTADNSAALSYLLDPLSNPLVVPCKRALGRALRRLWPARSPMRTYARSAAALERALRRAELEPAGSSTLGFGPFTFLTRPLLPDGAGRALDRWLSALARPARSPLRGAGLVHVLVARKIVCPPFGQRRTID